MTVATEFLLRPWGRLAFSRQGAGAPVVLLHSLALSRRMWDLLSADLAPGHELIAVDLRGHGESEWDRGPFSIGDLAADVVALLDELELPWSHVLGMSMGGTVAIELASTASGRVDRLVLCDTTAWYGADAAEAWEQRAVNAEERTREAQVAFQADRWFSERFRRNHPEQLAALVGIFLRTAPAAHAAASRALGAYDGRKRLPNISAPTLVVTGEQDYATPPAMGDDLAAVIPRAVRQVWSGLRHFALIESPALRHSVMSHLAGKSLADMTEDPDCCRVAAGQGGHSS